MTVNEALKCLETLDRAAALAPLNRQDVMTVLRSAEALREWIKQTGETRPARGTKAKEPAAKA